MSGARAVSFEVYYLQYGRWQIHHRYGTTERDEAIEEAKRLDTQGHFDASCVVREAWDNATGTASESVIYHSPKLKTKPPVGFITASQDGGAKPGGGSGSGARGPMANAPEGSAAANAMKDAKKRAEEWNKKSAAEAAQAKREPSIRKPPVEEAEADWATAIPKILLGFLAACVVGTIAGIVVYYAILQLTAMGMNLGRQVNQVVLIGAWFSGWAATFIPILRKILSKVRSGRRRSRQAAAAAGTMVPGRPRVTASQALSKATNSLAEQQNIAAGNAPSGGGAADAVGSPLDDQDIDLDGNSDPNAGGQVGLNEPEPDNQEGGEAEPPLPDPPEPQATPEGPEALTTALASLVAQAHSLSGNKLEKDHFLRFGAILFLAGAAESLSRRFKVAPKQVTTILADQIENMGVSSSMALGFAANIDEYLLDKRYFEMYSAGRSGALGAGGDSSSDTGIESAFQDWRSPKSPSGQDPDPKTDPKHYDGKPDEKDAHGFVAVLFTDIVNSTKKQQEMGDEWLMNVVRAHNDIVREAINKRGGREIKHTGDGIMASFPAVQGAVEAALAMQEGIARFSKMMPDLGFEICVGISAGEPIHESGDLFGTPVNLAARVLSKASANETAVSSIVREMCRGKHFLFEEIGRFELKGFDEAQPIFRVKDRRKKDRVPAQDQPRQAAVS